MRQIKYIVLHHTGGWLHQTVASIKEHWRSLGWRVDGYHHLIDAIGFDHKLVPIERVSNGVEGFNTNAIHISSIGGLIAKGVYADTRTPQQKATELALVLKYKKMYPNAVVLGHRDFSTDQNGNGIIDRWEYIKYCPGFDVRDWLQKVELEKKLRPKGIIYKLNYPLLKDSKVKEIQRALGVTIDGIFGKQTDKAVRDFQDQYHLPVTGIVDKFTAKMLFINL